ncbi:MAG TPA: hypothetical protein VG013_04360 [Gemmataceae bacterium]|jgi:hypothetical protein|nr:hypothetical protein [Gemmataceae bacterium]
MADRRFVSPPPSGQSTLGTSSCPRVADLINYALGQATSSDRQRIEGHLHDMDCSHCRRWIEKAGRFRDEPCPGAASPPVRLAAGPVPCASAARPTGDQTPMPESPKWQRAAFQELQQRLKLLENGPTG